jgi:Fic family protein
MSRICESVSLEIEGESVRAVVPSRLPPNPPLQITHHLFKLAMDAQAKLSELNGATAVLPSTNVFLYSYLRKEALLSAQIEGTRGSLSELLFYELEEAPGAPFDDIAEVSNYVRALEHATEWLREKPVGLRLLKEMHRILLQSGRGAGKAPGEFRRAPVWVHGSRPSLADFVPPPWQDVDPAMDALEKWINTPDEIPPLLKAGIAHVQFETIHPFLDGNGRLGRALITLMLINDRILRAPTLFLSLYFKQNREEYFLHLNDVRFKGSWEQWLEFFLKGVRDTAGQAAETAHRLLNLFSDHEKMISENVSLGRRKTSVLTTFHYIKRKAVFNSSKVTENVTLTQPAVDNAISALIDMGIVHEVTGRKRNRVYSYSALMLILAENTEPLN